MLTSDKINKIFLPKFFLFLKKIASTDNSFKVKRNFFQEKTYKFFFVAESNSTNEGFPVKLANNSCFQFVCCMMSFYCTFLFYYG